MRRMLAASLSFAAMTLAASPTFAGSLGGPLELQDEGSFFVGGKVVTSNFPDAPATGTPPVGQVTIDQMYVQYRIPKTISGPPIIMVHGASHTGVTFETTPDGREGWATYFTRRGFPVYVVDHAGRGRSGFDPTPLNRAKMEGNAASQPAVFQSTRERSYPNFRIGPTYPNPYPGSQFPVEAQDQYFAQLVPNAESTLTGGGVNTVNGLVALIDKVGPAVVLVHSQSGLYGLELARQRGAKMRALVSVEGGCAPVSADDVNNVLPKVPMLSVWGDNSVGAVGFNGDDRRNGCAATIKAVAGAGGKATFFLLPENGIKGNSHMMMLDKNNLQVADVIINWIGESARRD
jgi:pimeloyl-ACP methyl ester carboxylesterase